MALGTVFSSSVLLELASNPAWALPSSFLVIRSSNSLTVLLIPACPFAGEKEAFSLILATPLLLLLCEGEGEAETRLGSLLFSAAVPF